MPKPTLEVEILHKPQLQQVDFTFEMMGFEFSSSSTSDWNQCLLRSNERIKCYDSIMPEDISSRSSSGADASINGCRKILVRT
ncbi:hypothetical protein V6N13_142257 [Hibiscus sabdariffa]